MVFEIERNGHVSYLGGTVHLLRAQDYPLPPEFNKAYRLASNIVLETDMSAQRAGHAGQALVAKFQLEENLSTDSLLSAENWQNLIVAGQKVGFPVELFNDKHPVFHALTLLRLQFEKFGIGTGVDGHFFQQALADEKAIGKLETVQQQIDSLASMAEADPNQLIASTLEDVASLEELLDEIIIAWRNGDTDYLTTHLLAPVRDNTPAVYQALMVERNNDWMPQIEAFLATPETEFVLVGAAHLLGEHGLLRQLKDAGYCVSYLKP